jgi:hypothetical protein
MACEKNGLQKFQLLEFDSSPSALNKADGNAAAKRCHSN